MNNTANFFWYNNELSNYEKTALNSFKENGFNVNLWVYNQTNVDPYVNVCDANQLIPHDDIIKCKQTGIHGDGSIAAYSDLIRFKLLNLFPGQWWFDTDCICLKNVNEFEKLQKNKKIILAYQNDAKREINGAVASIPDEDISNKLLLAQQKIVKDKNYRLNWGDIGPSLLTNYINDNDLHQQILNSKYFYPNHFNEFYKIFLPQYTQELIEKTKDSLVIHLWNELFKTIHVDKTKTAPKNSYIEYMMNLFNVSKV